MTKTSTILALTVTVLCALTAAYGVVMMPRHQLEARALDGLSPTELQVVSSRAKSGDIWAARVVVLHYSTRQITSSKDEELAVTATKLLGAGGSTNDKSLAAWLVARKVPCQSALGMADLLASWNHGEARTEVPTELAALRVRCKGAS